MKLTCQRCTYTFEDIDTTTTETIECPECHTEYFVSYDEREEEWYLEKVNE